MRPLKLVALLTQLALSHSLSFAQSDNPTSSAVTIFGLLDAGVEVTSVAGSSRTRLVSGGGQGSRLGFRGEESLGPDLSALYRLEMGINVDDGTLGQGGKLFGREAYVGVSSKSTGTVTFGRILVPYATVMPAVDAFRWMGGGGLLALTRSGASSRQVLPLALYGRHDNAISYATPNLSGFQARALISLGEESPTIGDAYGAAARYNNDDWDLVLGYGRQQGAGVSGGVDAYVIGGSYKLPRAQLFFGITGENNACRSCNGPLSPIAGIKAGGKSAFRITNFGVRVPLGGLTAIAQIAKIHDRSDYSINPGSRDASWLSLGAEYLISRRTVLYSSLSTIGNRNGSQYVMGTGSAQQPAGVVPSGGRRVTALSAGVRHSF